MKPCLTLLVEGPSWDTPRCEGQGGHFLHLAVRQVRSGPVRTGESPASSLVCCAAVWHRHVDLVSNPHTLLLSEKNDFRGLML